MSEASMFLFVKEEDPSGFLVQKRTLELGPWLLPRPLAQLQQCPDLCLLHIPPVQSPFRTAFPGQCPSEVTPMGFPCKRAEEMHKDFSLLLALDVSKDISHRQSCDGAWLVRVLGACCSDVETSVLDAQKNNIRGVSGEESISFVMRK